MTKTKPSPKQAVAKKAPKAPAKGVKPAGTSQPKAKSKAKAPLKPASKAAKKPVQAAARPAAKTVSAKKGAVPPKKPAPPAAAASKKPVAKSGSNGKAKTAAAKPAKAGPAPKPAPPPAVKKPLPAPSPLPAAKKKALPPAPGAKVAAKSAATPAKAAPPKTAAAPAQIVTTAKAAVPAKITTTAQVAKAAPAPAEQASATKAAAPEAKGPAAKAAAAPTGGKKGTPVAPAAPPPTPRPPVISKEKPTPTKSGAIYYDSHMHTPLCKHAWGEPEEYAAQALKAGLKGIIFTCHCPMPDGFWPTVRMAESEFDTYLELVRRAADAYKGKLDVRLGLESEYFPGYEGWIESLHQRADFDYILGAVHWQAKEYLSRYESGTIESFRRTYFDHLAASAETGLYDCLAHPDLVKNYHPDSWCFAIIKNAAATALDRIAKTGVAMELNTSGLNKSYSEMNPGNEMLRMMAERKIPVVVGSDAHRAHRVGEHFVTALNNLSEAGYEHVSYFVKRERVDLKISEVIASVKKAADANA